jgi:hypothetical protein
MYPIDHLTGQRMGGPQLGEWLVNVKILAILFNRVIKG